MRRSQRRREGGKTSCAHSPKTPKACFALRAAIWLKMRHTLPPVGVAQVPVVGLKPSRTPLWASLTAQPFSIQKQTLNLSTRYLADNTTSSVTNARRASSPRPRQSRTSASG